MKKNWIALFGCTAATFTLFFQNCGGFSALVTNKIASVRRFSNSFTVPTGGVGVSGRSFVYRATGEAFQPRGVNWNRHTTRNLPNGQPEWWYSTFDAGKYNAAEAQQILSDVKYSGYNYLRVFISGGDPDAGFGLSGPGVSATYVANIADFLNRAKAIGLYIILTGQFAEGQWLPANYLAVAKGSPAPNTDGINSLTLDPSYARALGLFYKDLLTQLKAQPNNPLAAVFSIDMHNEISVNKHNRPYSLSSGSYRFGSRDYDLADGNQRQALIDDSTVSWINTVATAVREVAPEILIAPSVFTIAATGNSGFNGASLAEGGDGRVALRPRAIARSTADYIDLHIYPSSASYSFEDDLQREEVTAPLGKPMMIGEIGVFRRDFGTREAAENFLRPTLARACQVGISGFGVWDWDTVSDSRGGTWSMVEDNGALNALFAPNANPDICSGGPAATPTQAPPTPAPPTPTPAPPTPARAPVSGFFNVGNDIYWSNGTDAFCHKMSWDDVINTGGKLDHSNITPLSQLPTNLRNDGPCPLAPQPAGFFKVDVNGGIYYSNGQDAFCGIPSWDKYLAMGGQADQSNVTLLHNGVPGGMRNDGTCQ